MYTNHTGRIRRSTESESTTAAIDPDLEPAELNLSSGQRQRSSTLDTSIPLTIIRLLPPPSSSVDLSIGFQADRPRRMSFPHRAVIFRPYQSARPCFPFITRKRSSSAQPRNSPSRDIRYRSLELTNRVPNHRKVLALDSALQELCIRPTRSAAGQEQRTWKQDESRSDFEMPGVKRDLRRSAGRSTSAKVKLKGRRYSAELESGTKSRPLSGGEEEVIEVKGENSPRKCLEIHMPKINF